jgi:ATP-dependent Lhr-like helicase
VDRESASSSHRPGRKAGAVVVLVNGDLALYVERGGRSVLSFIDPVESRYLTAAAEELACAARSGLLGRVLIQRVDGEPALTHARERAPVVAALLDAGFAITPRGLRVRAG